MIEEDRVLSEQSADASRRQRRRQQLNDVERRVIRVRHLILMGELSAARQTLEGTDLTPSTDQILSSLRTRPVRRRTPLPLDIFYFRLASPLQLDEDVFAKNIRSSKRGVAGGSSGMNVGQSEGHSRYVLFLVSEILTRTEESDEEVQRRCAGDCDGRRTQTLDRTNHSAANWQSSVKRSQHHSNTLCSPGRPANV